ncbi:MAG TPA: N-acetylglucosamine-6-phosphate deacetylase [Acidimicrobiales bacterium]|nr:N-acetylglucosamine-6-phosphate deacetylase [Acidimicrobiales bacterium]
MDVLRASTVITPDGPIEHAEVEIAGDGTISAVRTAPPDVDVPDRILVPGFVDLQVNGVGDIDCASASEPRHWDRIDEQLVATGVTSWCPTLVTSPLDAMARRIGRVAEAMARPPRNGARPRPQIVGAHLEGPFLGGATGAHRKEWVIPLDLGWLAEQPLGEVVRIVTLGPEQADALEAIRLLTRRGVLVSLGHSRASYEQALAGADAGARLVTHLFNGMDPLHHRTPGLVGAALTDARLTPSLIADGVHVHPAALTAAARAKGPGGWILVTDAIGWASGRVADRQVTVVDGAPRLPDGTLAGSSLTMDVAVRRMVVECGLPLEDVVAAAATVPARLVGAADRGAIASGLRADLVCLTPVPELRVAGVWIGGLQAVDDA